MKEINWQRVAAGIRLWQVIVAVTAGVVVAGVMWTIGDKLPPQIPLWYSRPWGEDQLSPPQGLIWPVAMVTGIVGLGWGLSKTRMEGVLITFVSGAGLAAELIVVLGIIRIILIIT